MRTEYSIPFSTPIAIKQALPITPKITHLIHSARQQIQGIISGKDKRLLVIVGPCSIHDSQAALEYAAALQPVAKKLSESLFIVMRTYFEKPRTSEGWRGFIADPHLDGSHEINTGLTLTRKLLLDIHQLGIVVGTEFLNPIIPHYLADLISWGAIGARTVESQIHRELASGLPMPIGFKNNTSGNIQTAIDALYTVQHPRHFLSISEEGFPVIFKTNGNPYCHIILRGSHTRPNFYPYYVTKTINSLQSHQLNPRIMIDCSHGNTGKNYQLQARVVDSICGQIKQGQQALFGVMLESNLKAGKQLFSNKDSLVYGQSITDACLSFAETVPLLEQLANTVKK